MSRAGAATAIALVALVVASSTFVPCEKALMTERTMPDGSLELIRVSVDLGSRPLEYRWVWDRTEDTAVPEAETIPMRFQYVVRWPILLGTQALLLLLGGGLLTWVVRRERRRPANASR